MADFVWMAVCDLVEKLARLEIPGTKRLVVNPAWGELDRRFRSLNGKLQQRRAQFAAHAPHPEEDARSLLRDLFRTDADLAPDIAAGVLRVSVHGMANPRSNRAIRHLLDKLNAAEFTFPGIDLKLEHSLLGSPAQPPPDVTGANWSSAEIRWSEGRPGEPGRPWIMA